MASNIAENRNRPLGLSQQMRVRGTTDPNERCLALSPREWSLWGHRRRADSKPDSQFAMQKYLSLNHGEAPERSGKRSNGTQLCSGAGNTISQRVWPTVQTSAFMQFCVNMPSQYAEIRWERQPRSRIRNQERLLFCKYCRRIIQELLLIQNTCGCVFFVCFFFKSILWLQTTV